MHPCLGRESAKADFGPLLPRFQSPVREAVPYSSRRLERASAMVTPSAYSRSPPTGRPRAMRVTRTPSGPMSLDRYAAVASPSTLGLVASTTSRTSPAAARRTSGSTFSSDGPIPPSGERRPPSTWYIPRYSPVRSMAMMSLASSTTHTRLASRRGLAQIGQGLASVRLPHTPQGRTRSRMVTMPRASRCASSAGAFSRWKASRSAVFRPIPGSRASSSLRSSMADKRALQLGKREGEVEAARDLLHLVFVHLLGAVLRLGHGGQHQVLEHLHVAAVGHGGVDLDRADLAAPVGGGGHHPAAAGAGHGLLAELGLELREAALDLLAHLQQLLEVRVHRSGPRPHRGGRSKGF